MENRTNIWMTVAYSNDECKTTGETTVTFQNSVHHSRVSMNIYSKVNYSSFTFEPHLAGLLNLLSLL